MTSLLTNMCSLLLILEGTHLYLQAIYTVFVCLGNFKQIIACLSWGDYYLVECFNFTSTIKRRYCSDYLIN